MLTTCQRPVGKDEERESKLVFPVAMYSQWHYHGWQKCLKDFGIDRKSFARCAWKPELMQSADPFTPRGEEDGYNACRREILQLRATYDEQLMRHFAKAVYHPVSWGPPPPPLPKRDDSQW